MECSFWSPGSIRDYVAVSVETTGLSCITDLIGAVHVCTVQEGQPVGRDYLVLDLTADTSINQAWLHERLEDTRRKVEEPHGRPSGRKYGLNYDRLAVDGMVPELAMESLWQKLTGLLDCGYHLIGHNLIGFHLPFLQSAFRQWLKQELAVPKDQVFDVGLWEKAVELELCPGPGQSMRSFFDRVAAADGTYARWSVDASLQRYGLIDRYGPDIRHADTAFLSHLIFQHAHLPAGTATA